MTDPDPDPDHARAAEPEGGDLAALAEDITEVLNDYVNQPPLSLTIRKSERAAELLDQAQARLRAHRCAPSVAAPPQEVGTSFTWRVEVAGMAGENPEISAEIGIPAPGGIYRWEPIGDFLARHYS